MEKILQQKRTIAILLAIFVAATFGLYSVTPALAAGSNTAGLDWAFVNGNQANQNYNPQNQITAANADNLQIGWVFPIPGTPSIWSAQSFPGAATGIGATPLVYKGIVYMLTQYEEVFALAADSGNVIWSTQLPVFPNETTYGGFSIQHFHNNAFAMTTNNLLGGPTVWVAATNQNLYAIDATTGKIKLTLNFLPNTPANHYGIPGNLGTYSTISPGILVDQQRGIVITSAMGTSTSDSGRGFFKGWDVTQNPPKLLWTTFTSAPQDASDLSWDLQNVNNMTGAWIFNGSGAVNLKTLSPSVANDTLYNDWGYKESPACQAALGGKSPGGVGASWGGPWVLDEHTGVAFVATNNRNPYDSACTPGPDLWSAAVLALNDQTGQLIWGFQTTAHDSWDYDCAWNQALANETIAGVQKEVVFKTCKNAYMYELDAQTGQLYWYWTPPTSDLHRCRYCYLYDPLNRTQMTSAWPSPDLNAPMVQSPGQTGGFENDFAFDPSANIIVAVNHNVPWTAKYVAVNQTNYDTTNGYVTIGGYQTGDNATAYGINAATGQEVWHYYIKDIGYRGGVTVSGGVAYLTLSTGHLVMLDVKTGTLISDKLIGGPLNTLPAMGATANGQEELFVPITAGLITFASTTPPGALVMMTLAPSANTQTATLPSGTVTVTGTGQGGGGTAASGIDPTTFYAVAGLAVVFILATGFLAMRRRKPAS